MNRRRVTGAPTRDGEVESRLMQIQLPCCRDDFNFETWAFAAQPSQCRNRKRRGKRVGGTEPKVGADDVFGHAAGGTSDGFRRGFDGPRGLSIVRPKSVSSQPSAELVNSLARSACSSAHAARHRPAVDVQLIGSGSESGQGVANVMLVCLTAIGQAGNTVHHHRTVVDQNHGAQPPATSASGNVMLTMRP